MGFAALNPSYSARPSLPVLLGPRHEAELADVGAAPGKQILAAHGAAQRHVMVARRTLGGDHLVGRSTLAGDLRHGRIMRPDEPDFQRGLVSRVRTRWVSRRSTHPTAAWSAGWRRARAAIGRRASCAKL